MSNVGDFCITPSPWTQEAAALFRHPAIKTDAGTVQAFADAGGMWRMDGAAGLVGFYVLALEPGDEALLLVAVGNAPGHDLTAEALPAIEEQARSAGCRSFRIHTRRPGLAKKLAASGYDAQVVMRKIL